MPSLCGTFEALAVRTWLYLDAAQQTEIRIGEETLTDINLIDIQDRHRGHIVTVKFPKHMEAVNGADWEWWLLARGSALGVRLQAKKLYPNNDYMSLYDRHRAQATTLIHGAAHDGVTPLYCFYNHRDRPERAEWPQLDPKVAIEQMGCALASAHKVHAEVVVAHAPPTVETLGAHQVPWRDLVCDGGRNHDDDNDEGHDEEDNDTLGGRDDGDDVPPDPGGVLDVIRMRLIDLAAEYGAPEPQIIPETEIPEYVVLARTGEGMAYRRKVPARRVTIIDFNELERNP